MSEYKKMAIKMQSVEDLAEKYPELKEICERINRMLTKLAESLAE